MKTVVTGFDRFGAWPYNPTQLITEQLASSDASSELTTRVLPTAYEPAGATVEALIETIEPDLLILFGLGGNRRRIGLERIALNLDDASLADNLGVVRCGAEIKHGAPLALGTRVDLDSLCRHMRDAGHDTEISNHAGTFVCNHVYFRALLAVARHRLSTHCLFVHLPMTDAIDVRACGGGQDAATATNRRKVWYVSELYSAAEALCSALAARRRTD